MIPCESGYRSQTGLRENGEVDLEGYVNNLEVSYA
jgi:hypothetical protein